jgi:hypothetical protein
MADVTGFLEEAGIDFDVLEHARTVRAAEEAAALGIGPEEVAKDARSRRHERQRTRRSRGLGADRPGEGRGDARSQRRHLQGRTDRGLGLGFGARLLPRLSRGGWPLPLDAGGAARRGEDARVAVLPAHLVARWLLLEDVLDHTPGRVSSLRSMTMVSPTFPITHRRLARGAPHPR